MKLNFDPLGRNPLARNPRLPEATAAIKEWARTALGLDEDAVVSINELSCSQPDCPPRETVLLVLRSGAPAIRISIHKAIVDIGEPDVLDACLGSADVLEARATPGPPL